MRTSNRKRDVRFFHPHPSPPAAAPPSPVRGKAPTLALAPLHSSLDSRTDKPSPLAGEGGTRSVTDEGEEQSVWPPTLDFMTNIRKIFL